MDLYSCRNRFRSKNPLVSESLESPLECVASAEDPLIAPMIKEQNVFQVKAIQIPFQLT
jgi:hypothetical protein